MKNLTGLILFLTATTAFPSVQIDLRLIETSPAFAKAMVVRYPEQVRTLSPNVILVPIELVGELSQVSHETTGRCGGFMDITGEGPRKITLSAREALPPLAGKKEWISAMLDEVRAGNIKDFVNLFAGQFKTRSARSTEGERAPQWLRNTWQKMADDAGRTDIVAELVPAPSGYRQNSVRITIPGKNLEAPIVVMGAHLDSINRGGDTAPGADDDASGISALTETFRIMLAHNVQPFRTIQIFGYAAEEMGLLGSRAVAESYQARNLKVRAVLQLDMIAYPGESKSVTFITDNVDKGLTLWTEQLYGLYIGGQIKEEQCGYGCSDHASWNRYGYPAVLPFEAPMDEMNRRIHTSRDLWDELLDADYAARFVKLALAFTAELSQ